MNWWWNKNAMDYNNPFKTPAQDLLDSGQVGTGAMTEIPEDLRDDLQKINVDKTKRSHQMTCYNCNGELIWGGDHDIEEEFDHEDAHSMSTNLSCKDCGTFVIVYTPKSFLKGKTE